MSIRQQRINNKKNQIELSKILFNLIYKEKVFRKKLKITKFKTYKINGQIRFDCYFENNDYIIFIVRSDASIKSYYNSLIDNKKELFFQKDKSKKQFIRDSFNTMETYVKHSCFEETLDLFNAHNDFYIKCFQHSFKLFFEENSQVNLIQFDRKNPYAKNIFWVRHKNNYSYQAKSFNDKAIYFEEGILGDLKRSYSVNTFIINKKVINNPAQFKKVSTEYITQFLINKKEKVSA